MPVMVQDRSDVALTLSAAAVITHSVPPEKLPSVHSRSSMMFDKHEVSALVSARVVPHQNCLVCM